MKKINPLYTRIAQWARRCPDNFEHYRLLLAAEIAMLNQDVSESIKSYDAAIEHAENRNALHIIGLANERAGRCYLRLNSKTIAKNYIRSADHAYRRWQADIKCHELEKEFPSFFDTVNIDVINHDTQNHSATIAINSIDVYTLLKSTQILFSEIQLEKLLQKMLILLLQNAGAERGMLLTENNGDWFVEVEGSLAHQTMYLNFSENMLDRTDLPFTLIRYVQRTRESLLIQDADSLREYIDRDNYLSTNASKSLLVLPIMHKNVLQGMLYLENNISSYAFTPMHLHLLKVLSSQVAISLVNAHLFHQASHDAMTGLVNRNFLSQTFSQKMKYHKSNETIALLFFDLDYLKEINDKFGHEVGDLLLIHFSHHLKSIISENDVACRLGGDEFVVLCCDKTQQQITSIITKLYQFYESPIEILMHKIQVSFSVGVTLNENNYSAIASALKEVDLALYAAKQSGKNQYKFYTDTTDTLLIAEDKKRELELALSLNQLTLVYQPICNCKTQKTTFFEALIRWNHPKNGLLGANAIIPVAESSDLMLEIGDWVVKNVVNQIRTWQDQSYEVIPVTVNLSAIQLKSINYSQKIINLLKEYSVDPRLLEIEITETVLLEKTQIIYNNLLNLHQYGIKISLDDFGTGFSGYEYLKRFPIDKIKIGQEFILHMVSSVTDRAITSSIIHLAHELNMDVIAEGVETDEQYNFLSKHNADYIQGYYFNRPLSVKDCQKILALSQRVSK